MDRVLLPLSTAVSGIVGLFSFGIGLHDALYASERSKLLGLILAVAGVLSITGALALLIYPDAHSGEHHVAAEGDRKRRTWLRDWIPMLRLLGQAAAGFTSFLILVITLSPSNLYPSIQLYYQDYFTYVGTQHQLTLGWIAGWATAFVVIVIGLVRIPRALPAVPSPRVRSKIVQQIVAIIVGGGLSGAFQFWYAAQVITPGSSPSLVVQAELHQEAPISNARVISGKLTIKNPSEDRVSVLGSLYRVTAFEAGNPPDLARQLDFPDFQAANAYLNGEGPAEVGTGGGFKLVQVNRITPAGWHLDHGGEYTRSFVAYVPLNYKMVRLSVEVMSAKTALLDVDNEGRYVDLNAQIPRDRIDNQLGIEMPIVDSSWLQRVTRPARRFQEEWFFEERDAHPRGSEPLGSPSKPSPYYPRLFLCLFDDFGTASACSPQSAKSYGISGTASQYELSLSGQTQP